jgi:hypothetical protein
MYARETYVYEMYAFAKPCLLELFTYERHSCKAIYPLHGRHLPPIKRKGVCTGLSP